MGNIYKLDRKYPAMGFCLLLMQHTDKQSIANDLLKMIEYFSIKSIPHNIIWTFGTLFNREIIKIYIFPRYQLSDKQQSQFNIAFCELMGYVPVGGNQ